VGGINGEAAVESIDWQGPRSGGGAQMSEAHR
jgi:hypothetical protein